MFLFQESTTLDPRNSSSSLRSFYGI
uniref:Uncharacterized protein n=1 Tax=Arundo donax TaxID=35708 RepID=A0A0A9GY98_ARUDO